MNSKAGTLYMLEDEAYPDYFCMGWTTDSKKKLTYHNGNRPIQNQCKVVWESEWIKNIDKVHTYLIRKLTSNADYKKVKTASNRWHHKDNQNLLDKIIQESIYSGYKIN